MEIIMLYFSRVLEFAKNPGGKISHVLEQYLSRIAATGITM